MMDTTTTPVPVSTTTTPFGSCLHEEEHQQHDEGFHPTASPSQLSWSVATHAHQHEDIINDSRRAAKTSESSSDDDDGRGTTTIHSSSPTAKNSIYSNDEKADKQQWYRVDNYYTKYSRSLLLENKASVARDHMANERTFLAWLRTSLSLITVGVAITQLYHLSPEDTSGMDHRRLGRTMGVLFVSFSLLFLYFGNARYFHAQHAMCNGFFPASRGTVLFASASILGMLVAIFVVLLMQRL